MSVDQGEATTMSADKKKDGWDKADIIGKLISGVLLVVLSVVLKQGADKIQQSTDRVATALRKGEFVQKLVGDLSQPTDKVRRDVALIALNRSVVDPQDVPLVMEIVEHIFRNSPKEPANDLARNVAFRIIEERNPTRANEIRNELLSAASSEEGIRATLRSDPVASAQPEKEATLEAQQISAAFPKIVYIQFQGSINRDLVKELMISLSQQGYPAPGVERVAANYKNSVRYFHKEDKALADAVAGKVRQFFEGKSCPANFEVQDLTSSKSSIQKGQIEVWINMNCSG